MRTAIVSVANSGLERKQLSSGRFAGPQRQVPRHGDTVGAQRYQYTQGHCHLRSCEKGLA